MQFKITEGMHNLDKQAFGVPRLQGVDKASGADFTLTATKTLPNAVCGRPLILAGGLRWSRSAQIGLVGFGDNYKVSGEGSVVCMLTDDVALGYEFRVKRSQYRNRRGLMASDDNWHDLFVSWGVVEHLTLAGVWSYIGATGNAVENCLWGFQVQYGF